MKKQKTKTKQNKGQKKKTTVPALSNINFSIDQMSLKDHQNIFKKFYRLFIHILLLLQAYVYFHCLCTLSIASFILHGTQEFL